MVVDDDRSSAEGSERVVEFLSHGMADLVSYGNADRDIDQVSLSLSQPCENFLSRLCVFRTTLNSSNSVI